MVIQGDADRILPIRATGARLREALDESRYVVVKDGPHGVLWTHADEVNRELLGFLEQRIPREVMRTAAPV